MSTQLFEQIFEKLLEKVSENNNQMSNQVIGDLISLFDMTFIECLPIVDNKRVTLFKSSSGRQLFEVDSYDEKKRPTRNMCFIDSNYCNCWSFTNQGIKDNALFWCKHLIAAKLSNAMKCCKVIEITEEEMKKMLIENIFSQ